MNLKNVNIRDLGLAIGSFRESENGEKLLPIVKAILLELDVAYTDACCGDSNNGNSANETLTTLESVTISGTTLSVSYKGEDGVIQTKSVDITSAVKASETQTTLNSLTLSNNILSVKYTGENGVVQTQTVDLSSLIPSTVDCCITDISFDPTTGVLTLTKGDGSTITEDLSALGGKVVVASTTSTNETLAGAKDGSATINGGGGIAPYTYSIDGGVTWQSSNVFPNLAPGTYTPQIKDATGKISTGEDFTIGAGLGVPTVSPTNETTPGSGDGSATITPNGGTAPYQYSIDGGATWQSSNTFPDLAPGTYTPKVKDANGNIVDGTPFTIGVGLSASIVSTTNESSYNGNNGTITLSAANGTAPYKYSINGGATWSTSPNFTNLAPGVYMAQVKDANGTIIGFAPITIESYPCSPLNATVQVYDLASNPIFKGFDETVACPDATVRFEDLAGNFIAYIYPTQINGATVAVYSLDGTTLLGYAY